MRNLIPYLNRSISKTFKITFTILFILINVVVIGINTIYINTSIETQNENLVEMVEHLIAYTDDETAITYLEHYGHTHAVYLTYETTDSTHQYTTQTPPSGGGEYDVYLDEQRYASITIDNAQSNLFLTNLFYLFTINLFLIVLYISFIIYFTKQINQFKTHIENDLMSLKHSMHALGKTKTYYFEDFNFIAITFDEALHKIDSMQQSHYQEIQSLAHDLKTPLTIISGLMDGVIHDRIALDKSLMDSINEESEKMSNLINEIIEGSEEKNITSINFSALCEEVIEYHKVLYTEKTIRLKYDIQSEVFLKGNHKDLKRVLDHLFQNALKYSPSSSEVTVYLDDERFSIMNEATSKNDSSIEQPSNIFSPKSSGKGLKIVEKILSYHGFSLAIEDASNKQKKTIIHFRS